MKKRVMLSIRGRQTYMDQEPEIIDFVTEGLLTRNADAWEISYEESALTGMEGVTTNFIVFPGKIVLRRTGKLKSEMVFQEGVLHDSLYQLEFGALMITVCATRIDANLNEDGGVVDLVYGIEIEQSEGGVIEYHLEVRPQNS